MGCDSIEIYLVTYYFIFVLGGLAFDLDTTELVTTNQSQSHVRLPVTMVGHCMLSINQTHYLLTGGGTGAEKLSTAYLYSEDGGFSKIEDMKTSRYDHGCSVINNSTVLVAGGSDTTSSTEYLDLTSLTWSPGPELPQEVTQAQILGPEVLGPQIRGHLLIGEEKIFKLFEVDLAKTRRWEEVKEIEYAFSAQAFVVNKNVFC